MSFTALLCHTARLQICERINTGGRITETWQTLGFLSCRFTNPSTDTVTIAASASAEQVDATVFAGPELQTLIAGTDLPVRLVTTDSGIAGTYAVLRPIRVYCRKTSEVHHCECYVRKVQP